MSRQSRDHPPKRTLSLGEHVRRGLREAHAWRPTSFYMLLATPVVLVLAAHMFEYRSDPLRFASVLSLLFVFFGLVAGRALLDVLQISRRRLSVQRQDWEETLGDARFLDTLREIRDLERGK